MINVHSSDHLTRSSTDVQGFSIAMASTIADFYAHQNVFITGATGFMGKVLVEKLLRSCPDIGNIYVLVRSIKGKSAEERMKQTLESKLYDLVRERDRNFAQKVIAVNGDILQEGLGINAADYTMLCQSVSIVFHCAATVKFDEVLKQAMEMNVLGTRRIVELSRKMSKLKALIHVSTAYANCDKKEIDEQIYKPPVHHNKVLQAMEWMDNEMTEAITAKLISPRPNTYTFTKALAEYLLLEEASDLPVAIVRPSIVGASWREPFPGWVDNFNGPTGLLAGIGKGILRTMIGARSSTADLIPVDIATNVNIAVGWATAVQPKNGIKVYNCTTGQLNRVTWGYLEEAAMNNFLKNPLDGVFRVPYPKFTSNTVWHYLKQVLDQNLPAWIADQFLRIVGKKPIMMRIQFKLQKGVKSLDYFTSNQWIFSNNNLRELFKRLCEHDRVEFDCDVRQLNWDSYWENYCLGTKKYVLKEDMANMPRARQDLIRLQRISTGLNFVLIIVIWRLLMTRVAMARNLWHFLVAYATKIAKRIPGFAKSS